MNQIVLAFWQHNHMEKNNQHKPIVVTNCGYCCVDNFKSVIRLEDDNEDYLLLYQHKGYISFKKEGKKVIGGPGSVILIKPNSYREYVFLPAKENLRYYVYFKGVECENFLKQLGLEQEYHLYSPGILNSTLEYFDKIINAFSLHDFDTDIFRTTYLLRLLTAISKKISDSAKNNKNPLAPALEYIEKEYSHDISIAECARLCKYSPANLIRQFKKQFNLTPKEYLNRFRIEKAIYLLIECNMQVNDVAFSVGFNDPFYFSKFFKQQTGLSPTAYKKKHIVKMKKQFIKS